MPELPEVEIARRQLVRWMSGTKVLRAEAERTSRVFRGAQPRDFEAIRGRLQWAERRGKYLMLAFDNGRGTLAHLGMTGKFVRRRSGDAEPWSRARFVLEDGHTVHFRDPRLFGRIEPVAVDDLRSIPAVASLGVDPLVDGLTAAQLADAVGPSKQDLKVALMDQGRIAGLGNIHAAEALFRARLNPARKPGTLTAPEWRALAKAIHAALAFALDEADEDEIAYVEEPGTENPFLIYGRAGEPCRRCRTQVRSFSQGGRTTHFCPTCQPRKPKR